MTERRGAHAPDMNKARAANGAEFDWEDGEIPRGELEIKAVRGGGPGGQAINTTSNNMEVRWNIGRSASLTPEQKATVRAFAGRRVTKADELIFTCQSERSQKQNTDEAIRRLNDLLREALTPVEERIETGKPKGVKARERRSNEANKRRKQGRQKVRWD